MISNLASTAFLDLLRTVFRLRPSERACTILVDLPDPRCPDTPAWSDRRILAGQWWDFIAGGLDTLPFTGAIYATYPNVGITNGDLPGTVTVERSRCRVNSIPTGPADLRELLRQSSVILAPTQFSATAPLKIIGKELGFRGATLPGFTRAMIPALGLDYGKVHERVNAIKARMDRATGARVVLSVEDQEYRLFLDLRHTTGHASGGLMPDDGMVGNLPSGEAYIVPFEGKKGDESRTEGMLPVQFGDEIVLFAISQNRAQRVVSMGPESRRQQQKLEEEPAYGNIAELGVGVLHDWGVKAVGSILLDEKLGLHIAFGRSDHFGGQTSPASFHRPENVVHIDWVYVPSCQPGIAATALTFEYPDGTEESIIHNGRVIV